MRHFIVASIACASLFAAGQQTKQYTPYYLQSPMPDFRALVPAPPAPGSAYQMQDAEAVRQAERTRDAQAVKAAQADDAEEDIFIYATLLGPGFVASELPLTAALSAHLRNDAGVLSPPLKAFYNRSRPFVVDSSLHPVCDRKTEGSYPSGHATIGYLTGFVLAEMLPEKAPAILARADGYAQHRIVCGVHYPSDVAASKTLALIAVGNMSSSARFQKDMQEAARELRQHLGMPSAVR